MQKGLLSAILMIGAITLCVLATAPEKPKTNDNALAGTWEAVEDELGGKPLPPEVVRAGKLILSASEYQVGNDIGTVEIDPTAKPTTITFNGIKGPNEGKTIPAIYELSGDVLCICYDLTGQKRPTTFVTKAGTSQLLVRYKKEESKS